jgi:hypothetical protein
VLARFSNGVGFDQHDLKPDVRGVTLKIFGVSDSSAAAEGQEPRTVFPGSALDKFRVFRNPSELPPLKPTPVDDARRSRH